MSRIIQIGNIFTRASFENPTVGRVYSVDGLCPTLNTNGGGYHLPMIIEEDNRNGENEKEMENEIKVIDNLGSYKPNGYNASCVVGGSGIAPTVRENHGEVTAVLEPKYRIRRLTERECFRLMDVDDADIDKMQSAGISKSQQYKLAGNSIAISPLYHIFRKMFVDKDNEQQQLTLF